MQIFRLFVAKRGTDVQAEKLKNDLAGTLGIHVSSLKRYIRYDVQNLSQEDLGRCVSVVFSEPPVDEVTFDEITLLPGERCFAVEFLPGQYDQRADSACQCVQFVTQGERPLIRCATVYCVSGVTEEELARIKNYVINPVEAREASLAPCTDLAMRVQPPEDVPVLAGFTKWTDAEIAAFHAENGFAMSVRDLAFVRDYFASEKRDPTMTEIKVIDTYWSDHCRHTTFATELKSVEIVSGNPHVQKALDLYNGLFEEFNAKRPDKYKCLMDVATIAVKKLKQQGLLDNLDESGEINACSVKAIVNVDGKDEEWLVMFKNETHNHPTEIEPFGGAATCLGGAIRDPLSGRTYVYQAMRVTGAADPNVPFDKTLKGKLPQRVLTRTAAAGFSGYGNQIGLATGIVAEVYHPNYVAKRLETGFVVGAARASAVVRTEPDPGDAVILLGGETGRDGCGGATGSSKAHTLDSLDECGAEVQKGNPLTERKLQRLFRRPELTKLIKRCNDFGAGGVCVAIGELSDGIDIDLDKVPKKYDGLGGTELAISESQERMAVVVDRRDAERFIELAAEENLNAVQVASVTGEGRMRMRWRGKNIVDISRAFLNTNGVRQQADAVIREKQPAFFDTFQPATKAALDSGDFAAALSAELSRLNVCSEKGLGETFDSTVGANTVFLPYGGKYQLTPATAMAAKLPTGGASDTATVAAYGLSPDFMTDSPFVGSIHSILTSVSKVIAAGAPYESVRLTLQEFFQRLNGDKERFGQPLAALLGALYAEIGLGLGAIGGKDSMSGTFENIDVPPTLISFALGIGDAGKLVSNVAEKSGETLYLLPVKRDEWSVPDFEYAKKLYRALHALIAEGKVRFATVVEEGGAACAAVKSCLGNKLGFAFAGDAAALFRPCCGDIVAALDPALLPEGLECVPLGQTTEEPVFRLGGSALSMEEAVRAFTGTLEPVFPTVAAADAPVAERLFRTEKRLSPAKPVAKPRVFIPVFPGTNCEYDTARAFERAGAVCETVVVKNRSAKDIEDSAQAIARAVDRCQILAFPGGFSGGDEPDGSGKFIVATFLNPAISEAVEKLLNKRDGLVLGICNGFQALVKLGLVPYGSIVRQRPDSPTLTFNNIARHVSTVVRVKVASNLSPWLYGAKVGGVYNVPVSHGEGRFLISPEAAEELLARGQIATQYADLNGNATMESPFNPNGSVYAVEGITSPDGRVYGKMGHSERSGKDLLKNVPGEYDMKLFESGVAYFK